MINTLSIVPAEARYAEALKELLSSEKLPVEDLPGDLQNFLIATDNGFVIGCIGLELYDRYGLLRSLVLKPEYRGMNMAGELVKKLELMAKDLGLSALYLLTETASGFFGKKGYTVIQRNEVPEEIKVSSEFSHVCPASAIVMQKTIR
jgi:amino-acid N-acetyltransferase